MKSRWVLYIAALVATAAAVTATFFLPTVLLKQQEERMLGRVSTIYGSYLKSRPRPQATPTAAASTTPAPDASTAPTPMAPMDEDQALLIKKLALMGQEGNRTVPSEPEAGKMTMKEAVNRCSKEMMLLMKTGTVLQLPNFPGDYKVEATMNRVYGAAGVMPILDLWYISFTSTKGTAGASLMMEVDSGKIIAVKMSSTGQQSLRLENSAEAFAKYLGIGGVYKRMPEKQGATQSGVWASGDQPVTLYFSVSISATSSSFGMYTRPRDASSAP